MSARNRILLDSDVALDHLADRQPFAEYAHRIFALAEMGGVTVFLSSLSFSNLYYILRKLKGHAEALTLLGKLRQLVRVAPVGKVEIDAALASGFSDFEDAIQHFAAVAFGEISAIVTRNPQDYSASKLPVLSPHEFLMQESEQT